MKTIALRLIKAARLLLASLHPNEVKTLIKQFCGDKYALFGDSISNITLIDRYGNKLQCFDNFYLIKATGEHTCLGNNLIHKAYPAHIDQVTFEGYWLDIVQQAEQHLGDKPTNLNGDRLIHATLAKLDAIASFHPELKNLVGQLENNDAVLRQFPQQDAIDFINSNNLQQAFNTLVRNKNLQQSEEQQPPPKLRSNASVATKRRIARNPSTHPDTLATLAEDTDTWIKRYVASNPSTHPDVLAKLAEDTDPRVKQNVARNPSTHPDTLAKLAKLADDTDTFVRGYVAENPSTHPDTLAKLADATDTVVRYCVAKNPSTQPNTLAKLSEAKDPSIRCGVALNTSTHPDTLAKLADDTDPWVRHYVSTNKHAPMSLVRRLNPNHPKLSIVRP